MPIVVKGVREMTRAFGRLSKEFPKDVRRKLKDAAEPVRAEAEIQAGIQIRNLGQGEPWAGMRTGGGVKIVYIAPKQRGRASKHDPRRRRPNLKPKLLRAMETAGERKSGEVKAKVDRVLLDALEDWSRG